MMLGFHQTFLNAKLGSRDAARVTAAEPCRDWFRLVSTNDGSANFALAVAPMASGGPIPTQKLSAWVSRIKTDLKACQGVSGPSLTSAAFNAGTAALQTTMEDNARNHLQFERDRSKKTFTDKHGDSVALQMHRLCNVHTDATLPEVNVLLVKSPENHDCAIPQSMINERAEVSLAPLTAITAPLVTPSLLDEKFRSL